MIFCQKNVLEVSWGLFKEMHTNTQGQSDIVARLTNILNKVSGMPKGLFTTPCQLVPISVDI